MKDNFYILPWDSAFFEYKVAKLKDDALSTESAKSIFERLNQEGIELIYYSSKNRLDLKALKNKYYNIKLVHKRILLQKSLTRLTPIHEKIKFYSKNYPTEKMVRLAQRAGSHGRFFSDSNITIEKYNELFKNWIINSVQKKMASDVLVYVDNEEVVGLATIKLEDDFAYMPLFAVDEKVEGRGISFALMRAVESVALQRGYKKVLGGTQEVNLKALKVYERFGINIIGDEFIYHLWRRKP